MDKNTPIGPNIKRLAIERCSQIMVEKAKKSGDDIFWATAARIADGDGARIKEDMLEAFEWVIMAVNTVRSAPDNPFKTDEDIAGEILRQVEIKKARK